MTHYFLRPFTLADYPAAYALWERTPGIGLSRADEAPAIARYLARNPGLSFVIYDEHGALVGTVLCGHDGRRGYLHHLAVEPTHQGRGLGRLLVERSLEALAAADIDKCHLFVYVGNARGQAFWSHIGWTRRHDLVVFSRYTPGREPPAGRTHDARRLPHETDAPQT
ncbi:MAG: GNAT family N-acetyltransferase [Chloroflexi bacterium]|nr:GNAT family N-acetyltransferase [Chloroflexota bacterium]